MGGGADASAYMDVLPYIAFVGDLGLTAVEADPDADLVAAGPRVTFESSLCLCCRHHGVCGAEKAKKKASPWVSTSTPPWDRNASRRSVR